MTQLLAVLVVATVPMAILQGSSTHNDLVVSLFVLTFFYFFARAAESMSRSDFLFAGLSLGLAVLSKGTAYIFCFPIGALIFAAYLPKYIRRGENLKSITRILAVIALALAINAGHYLRNQQTFGTPISSGFDQITNQNLSALMVFSNLVRNYSAHLGTIEELDDSFTYPLIHRLIGTEINNPDSTFLKMDFTVGYTLSENTTGSMIHIFLLSIGIFFAFVYRGGDEKKLVAIASLSTFCGFLIFCVLLKWHPGVARLQLPLFMLGATLITMALAHLSTRTTVFVAMMCFIGCLPALLHGEPRSLLPGLYPSVLSTERSDQYFAFNPNLAPAFLESSSFIKKLGTSVIVSTFFGFSLMTNSTKNLSLGTSE